jgi:hypothetical protein
MTANLLAGPQGLMYGPTRRRFASSAINPGTTMKLVGRDGKSVSIAPDGHELPIGMRDRDYDDWLWIIAQVVSAGNRWSFREPCLTGEEAQALGLWLQRVAGGSVPAFDPSAEGRVSPDLIFWKPNLAFSLAERVDDAVRIRVHFAAESSPPSHSADERWGTGQFFVELAIATNDLEEAAAQWDGELAAVLEPKKG